MQIIAGAASQETAVGRHAGSVLTDEAVFRGSRVRAGKAGTPGIMALNAIRAAAAQVTARAA
jgi:hypothetical protein